MGQILNSLDFVRIVAGFGRNWIAAMTGRATETDCILAILQSLQRLSGPILVHRFDLTMTRDTPLDLWDGSLRFLVSGRRYVFQAGT
jgi:hypothetical protein